jgi:ankyrin repeat protein
LNSATRGGSDPGKFSQTADTFSFLNLDTDDRSFEFDNDLLKMEPYRRALTKQKEWEREIQQPTLNLIEYGDLIDLSPKPESLGHWERELHKEFTFETDPDPAGESQESQEFEKTEGLETSDSMKEEVAVGTSQTILEHEDLPSDFNIPKMVINLGFAGGNASVNLPVDEAIGPLCVSEDGKYGQNKIRDPLKTDSTDLLYQHSIAPSSGGTSSSTSTSIFQIHGYHLLAPASQRVDRQQSLNSSGVTKIASLQWAIIQGDLAIVKDVLRTSGQFRDITPIQLTAQVGGNLVTLHGWTPLSLASYFGNLSIVKYLLKHADANLAKRYQARIKSNLKEGTPRLLSPVHAAVASVPYLLIFNSSFISSSPARNTSSQDLLKIPNLKTIRNKQRDLWEYPGQSSTSSENERLMILNTLSESSHRDFRLDVQENYGFSLLHVAACGTSLPVVQTILNLAGKKSKGLSLFKIVRSSGVSPDTPLHLAAFWNRTKAVEFFLDGVFKPNDSGYGGRTALHYAAAMGNVDVIDLLVGAKAKIDVLDNSGFRPLDLALRWQQWDALKALIKAGADLLRLTTYNSNHQNVTETILHTAVGAQNESGITAVT